MQRAGSSGLTFLIVEDHDRTREVMRDWLKYSFPGCECLEVQSGDEAVEMVAVRQPDITLMDIELPGMKGIETTRRIKLAAPRTAVIVVSIHTAPEYRSAAVAAGASTYVPKSAMHTDLIPAVRRLLGPSDR